MRAKYLGVYIFIQPPRQIIDVEVTMWVRESEAISGLDKHLFKTVESWVREQWPFRNPVFPGRTLSWQEWNSF